MRRERDDDQLLPRIDGRDCSDADVEGPAVVAVDMERLGTTGVVQLHALHEARQPSVFGAGLEAGAMRKPVPPYRP
jgi:hypothetical protein